MHGVVVRSWPLRQVSLLRWPVCCGLRTSHSYSFSGKLPLATGGSLPGRPHSLHVRGRPWPVADWDRSGGLVLRHIHLCGAAHGIQLQCLRPGHRLSLSALTCPHPSLPFSPENSVSGRHLKKNSCLRLCRQDFHPKGSTSQLSVLEILATSTDTKSN